MPFPLDQQYIASTEQQLGASLPTSYVAAMLKNNGGAVEVGGDEWQLYPILDPSDRRRLARTSNDVLRETAVSSQWDRFPKNAIAIVDNRSGDRLVFLRRGDAIDEGVYIWNHETRQIKLLAADFSELKRT